MREQGIGIGLGSGGPGDAHAPARDDAEIESRFLRDAGGLETARLERDRGLLFAPPQRIHLIHDGKFVGPFVYGYRSELDMRTLKRMYTPNPQSVQPMRFFCRGDEYRFWGLLEGDFHLVCPAEDGVLYLLGTDRIGRDKQKADYQAAIGYQP